jgi:2-dehydropantoate 2-reductase
VLDAAGIAYVSRAEDLARRGDLLTMAPVGSVKRAGGSTWQSLARGLGTVETDYLTGEIVLQGRLVGVATPVNQLLQRLTNELARHHRPPGAWREADVLALLETSTS